MLFRKHASATLWPGKDKYYKSREAPCFMFNDTPYRLNCNLVFLFIVLSAWLLVLLFWFPPSFTHIRIPSHTTKLDFPNALDHTKSSAPIRTCHGGHFVYVYPLPAEFNVGLLDDCRHLNVYTDMCPHVANCGLGQPRPNMGLSSWFATHQFIAEMIFHARVENHPCRTRDPTRANLFYVPFYGGLHASSKFRESNLTARDTLAVGLVDYIRGQPWWQKNNGKDHFLALGRTAWDFMRTDNGPDFGANSLLNVPSVQNMSVLTVERNPWHGSNQHGIPYPSYFHPANREEMLTWQNKMRQSKRPHLWSFIGGPRKGLEKAAIRDKIIEQCAVSSGCELVKCAGGSVKCHDPSQVLGVMTRSQFCVQAPGDSFTRRSTFDAVLAGCIPVFFSRHTAYTQYAWFLPEDPSSYSVYIDEKGSGSERIEEELLKISREKAERMRERVVELIPRLTYAHPNASDVGFEDAVDVALAGLAKHVFGDL